ncbi:MAG: 6-phosphogluconolactonase [Vicinamibacterales bacterium]
MARLDELRRQITESFESAIRERETLSLAVSGGATALVFLGALRVARVQWSRVTMFWADERAVPADSPESNYGVAERLLLDPLGAAAPRALRMPGDQPDLEEAALQYDETLAYELRSGPLDLALLGIGEDGHVCSLFPGHPALQQVDHRVIAIHDAPKPPPRRLSLTMSFLCRTRKIWLVVLGARKHPVLQAAMARSRLETPLDIVLANAKDTTIFTDQPIYRT